MQTDAERLAEVRQIEALGGCVGFFCVRCFWEKRGNASEMKMRPDGSLICDRHGKDYAPSKEEPC